MARAGRGGRRSGRDRRPAGRRAARPSAVTVTGGGENTPQSRPRPALQSRQAAPRNRCLIAPLRVTPRSREAGLMLRLIRRLSLDLTAEAF